MIFAHSPFVAVLAATLLSVQFAFSQEAPLNRFVVIDEQTLKPIPFVSISLLRANLYINTEDDGIFSIPGELPKIKDTLRVSAQNYATLLIPLGKLSAQNSIRLKPVPYKPNKAKRTLTKDSVLNDFNRRDITHYAGIQKTAADADHLQLAQQFDLPFAGALLREVTIHRLAFTFHHNGGIESTRFHLRVYGLDKNTGGPGKDLCGRIIEIKNRESKRISVNLQDDNIVIPDTTFFVAIEALRNYDNFGYADLFDPRTGIRKRVVNYRPAIAISPERGNKSNIWAMNMRQHWSPYTYFYPDFTDLAIKATIRK